MASWASLAGTTFADADFTYESGGPTPGSGTISVIISPLIGRPIPQVISHLDTEFIGDPVLAYDDDTGQQVDPTTLTTGAAYVPRTADGSVTDPTGLFHTCTWHYRADGLGVIRPHADLLIGPASSLPWPASNGDLDKWYRFESGTQIIIVQAPGRVVLT